MRRVAAQIATTFVKQYYPVRHATPGSVYRFYAQNSVVLWPSAAEFAAVAGAAPARPPGAPAQPLEQSSHPTAIADKVRGHAAWRPGARQEPRGTPQRAMRFSCRC